MKNHIMHNVDNVITDIVLIIENDGADLSELDNFYTLYMIRSIDSYLFFTDGTNEKTEN
jgi:hypothetical protein